MTATKKYIIYIGSFELPDKNAAAQRVISNGKIFRNLGCNVIFIGINSNLDKKTDIKKTFKKQFGFDTWEVAAPKNRRDWIIRIINPTGLHDVISQYPPKSIFAIIPYNYPAIAQNRIKIICKKNNAYYIPDITEWYESLGRGILTGAVKWLDTALRMKVINKQADALITTSTYLTKYYKPKVANILELPTLYDSKAIEPTSSINIEKKSTIRLLYAGNPFGPLITKNTRTFVKDRLDIIIILLRKLKHLSYSLYIYGLTQDRYLEIYPEHSVILLELEGKIIFQGRKPHQEVILAIQKSHFTIFFRDVTRLTEAGFPSKLSESITCGTPVITNRLSNIEAYIDTKRLINIIDLNNQKKRHEQMEQLLTLPAIELLGIKKECLDAKIFDYHNYIQPASNFFIQLNKEKS